ncbi:hypothetical protein [Prescottella sp. R16]|uniref:hypothetical protein n=1 Tax=Prescottella sp. R16 TaxID=3064529 RepID=UPI00272E41E2|nr:hypothetical protein [Prescottella sp. R16]
MIDDGPLRLERISALEASSRLRESLALPEHAGNEELTYEALRAVAWASTRGEVPVSTRTLLDRAMDSQMFFDDVDDATLRRTLRLRLSMLSAVGDVARVGRDQWLSVGGTVVRQQGRPDGLLVSGIPLRHLDGRTRALINVAGPVRRLIGEDSSGDYRFPTIDFDDWLRRPRQPLVEWTHGTVRDALVVDIPYDPAVTEQYYAPDHSSPGTVQDKRWVTRNNLLDGTYLVRRRHLDGSADYNFAVVQAGAAIEYRSCDRRDIRRLMFGFDRIHRNPTVARWTYTPDGRQLRLHNRLPHAETRALIVLAGPPDNAVWTVRHDATEVRKILTDLGVDLQD